LRWGATGDVFTMGIQSIPGYTKNGKNLGDAAGVEEYLKSVLDAGSKTMGAYYVYAPSLPGIKELKALNERVEVLERVIVELVKASSPELLNPA
jgi:hypothetical protein